MIGNLINLSQVVYRTLEYGKRCDFSCRGGRDTGLVWTNENGVLVLLVLLNRYCTEYDINNGNCTTMKWFLMKCVTKLTGKVS